MRAPSLDGESAPGAQAWPRSVPYSTVVVPSWHAVVQHLGMHVHCLLGQGCEQCCQHHFSGASWNALKWSCL